MSLHAVTHLNFRGNAREALEHYRSVFGGSLNLGTYAQSGVPRDSTDSERAAFDPVAPDAPDADLISFGLLMTESGFALAAYDVFGATGGGLASAAGSTSRSEGLQHDQPFFVVVNGDTVDDVRPIWEGLADGGAVIQALAPSDWSPAYGMVTDRFGVTWILGARG